jgi:hypothetical protein
VTLADTRGGVSAGPPRNRTNYVVVVGNASATAISVLYRRASISAVTTVGPSDGRKLAGTFVRDASIDMKSIDVSCNIGSPYGVSLRRRTCHSLAYRSSQPDSWSPYSSSTGTAHILRSCICPHSPQISKVRDQRDPTPPWEVSRIRLQL